MAYRSKSVQYKPNSHLSIETACFMRSYQILEHQHYIPFLKRQTPQTNQIPSQKECFTFKNIQHPSQNFSQQRPLVKTKSAIHELYELMTPKAQQLTSFGRIVDNIKMTQSIQHKKAPLHADQLFNFNNQMLGEEEGKLKNQNRLQKQKQSLKKVNTLLVKEQNKQRELQDNIVSLQDKINKIQQEKAQTQFLLRKLQHKHIKLEEKYKQVEEKLKKRVIVNLELEALMVSINMKNNQKLSELKNTIANLEKIINQKDKIYEGIVQKLMEEFESSKKVGQQQINSLVTQLCKRSNELAQLKSKQKTYIFDSQPIFDKFGVSTKNSNYFIQAPFLKNEQKQSSKNSNSKPITTNNSLVPQYPEINQLVQSSLQPKLKFQSLNFQNFSFGKNRPICISERI